MQIQSFYQMIPCIKATITHTHLFTFSSLAPPTHTEVSVSAKMLFVQRIKQGGCKRESYLSVYISFKETPCLIQSAGHCLCENYLTVFGT